MEDEIKPQRLGQWVEFGSVVLFFWSPEEGWLEDFVSESVRQYGYEPKDFRSGKVTLP